jgi:hypothetical protein
MAFDALVRKEGVRTLAQALLEAEVKQVGAGRYACAKAPGNTTASGNGGGTRKWGSIMLRVPGVQDGSYFLSLLTPQPRQ